MKTNDFDKNMYLLKASLRKMQKELYLQKTKRNIVFIIGSASEWNKEIKPNKWIDPENDRIYCAILPKNRDIRFDAPMREYDCKLPPGIEYIEIFDRRERRILSCMDAGVIPDLLVLADCINDNYKWVHMLNHHPLTILVTYINTDTAEKNINTENFLKYFYKLF